MAHPVMSIPAGHLQRWKSVMAWAAVGIPFQPTTAMMRSHGAPVLGNHRGQQGARGQERADMHGRGGAGGCRFARTVWLGVPGGVVPREQRHDQHSAALRVAGSPDLRLGARRRGYGYSCSLRACKVLADRDGYGCTRLLRRPLALAGKRHGTGACSCTVSAPASQ